MNLVDVGGLYAVQASERSVEQIERLTVGQRYGRGEAPDIKLITNLVEVDAVEDVDALSDEADLEATITVDKDRLR